MSQEINPDRYYYSIRLAQLSDLVTYNCDYDDAY